MNMDYCKPYAGRDTVILDRHAADTIAEDIRAFDSQLENHFAHVIMLAEQKIITRQDAAAILKALLKLKEMGPDKILPSRPDGPLLQCGGVAHRRAGDSGRRAGPHGPFPQRHEFHH